MASRRPSRTGSAVRDRSLRDAAFAAPPEPRGIRMAEPTVSRVTEPPVHRVDASQLTVRASGPRVRVRMGMPRPSRSGRAPEPEVPARETKASSRRSPRPRTDRTANDHRIGGAAAHRRPTRPRRHQTEPGHETSRRHASSSTSMSPEPLRSAACRATMSRTGSTPAADVPTPAPARDRRRPDRRVWRRARGTCARRHGQHRRTPAMRPTQRGPERHALSPQLEIDARKEKPNRSTTAT